MYSSKMAPPDRMTLEALASSAEEVVRQATEYHSNMSRSQRSECSEPENLANQYHVRQWIQSSIEEFQGENTSDAPPGSAIYAARTSITYRSQSSFVAKGFRLGMEAYNARNFTRSKDLLCTLKKNVEDRERSQARVAFQERNDLFPLLVFCYCRLEEWKNAEEIFAGMPFVGRKYCMKTVVGCYAHRKMWDDLLRILTQPSFPDEAVTEKPEEPWMGLLVAEIYKEKGDYDEAYRTASRAHEDINVSYGSDHIRFRMSAELLASIHELRGERTAAEILRDGEPVEELKGAFPTL
jgi:hypothetical protein